MSKINHGGPAFPVQDQQAIHAVAAAAIMGIEDSDERDAAYTKARAQAVGGMTLRDYFAGKALQGFLATGAMEKGVRYVSPEVNEQAMAAACYALADAMLRAREAA